MNVGEREGLLLTRIDKLDFREGRIKNVSKKTLCTSRGKRLFDVAASLVLIVITLPLMILIALAIKFSSKGPVLYISKRVGTNFRVFNFYKFRTMVYDADFLKDSLRDRNLYKRLNGYDRLEEEECPDCKRLNRPCSPLLYIDGKEICEAFYLKKRRQELLSKMFFKVDDDDDPRITRVGKFLRKTHLDELPQLFNVLKGDMSIVGNRPLPMEEAVNLTTDEWSYRFLAPSGITGLWQTHNGQVHLTEERIALDNQYAFSAGFVTDLLIIWRTVKKIFSKQKSNRLRFDD